MNYVGPNTEMFNLGIFMDPYLSVCDHCGNIYKAFLGGYQEGRDYTHECMCGGALLLYLSTEKYLSDGGGAKGRRRIK